MSFDARRAYAIRAGSIMGVLLLVAAAYEGLRTKSDHCPKSTPTKGFACDPGPGVHNHTGLALGLAVSAVVVFIITALFAYFCKPRYD
jgi:hypothetical protein